MSNYGTGGLRRAASPPDSEETVRSPLANEDLFRASLALETAYVRIRNFRQSLRQLDPAHDAQGVSAPNSLADIISSTSPGLPDTELAEEMARLRASLPPAVLARLEQFENTNRQETPRDSPHATPSDSVVQSTPSESRQSPDEHLTTATAYTYLTIPHSPTPGLRWPPRRPWLGSGQGGRRDIDTSDASTSLGRRVAAREAGAVSESTDPALSHLEELLARSSELLTELQLQVVQDQSMQRTTSEQSRQDLHHLRPNNQHRQPERNAGSRASQNRHSVTQPTPATAPRQSRSDRPYRSNDVQGRNATASHPFVVSLPSDPVRARSSPRDPSFDVPWPALQWQDNIETGPSGNRTYLVRRRVNAAGEEHVHNISLSEWEDDDPVRSSPLRQAPQDSHTQRPRTASGLTSAPLAYNSYIRARAERWSARNYAAQASSDSGQTATQAHARRRRAWARLDPDGNEISLEDEAEIERNLAQNRVRAHSRAPLAPEQDGGSRGARRQNLVPVTRTAIFQGTEDESAARVHLNSLPASNRRSRERATVQGDRSGTLEADGDHTWLSVADDGGADSQTPFCVDPLPMPLAEMAPTQRKAQQPRLVTVSYCASLIGR